MRITFIIPPSGFLLDQKVFPTLGILKVAAVREAAGDVVDVLDLSGSDDVESAVAEHLEDHVDVQAYGITATMPQMPSAAAMAEQIRNERPRARLILGGPHVTLMQSSARQERAKGAPGRACKAISELADRFDVLVCGDGERAISLALADDAPRLIDGDDAKSDLFLKPSDLDTFPFSARHLIDVDSYHYSINGVRAQSLIAQLGCLVAGTEIQMADGSLRPIENVKVGDLVTCIDESSGDLKTGPVARAWSRKADDLWELKWDNGRSLRVTAEHPIWTDRGWVEVGKVQLKTPVGFLPKVQQGDLEKCSFVSPVSKGESVDHLRPVREAKGAYARIRSTLEFLRSYLSGSLATSSHQPEMVAIWSEGDESQVGRHDEESESCQVQHQRTSCCSENRSSQKDIFRNQARRSESDEASRGLRESVSNDQDQVGQVLLRSDERNLAEGQCQTDLPYRAYQGTTEQGRVGINGDTVRSGSVVPFHWKQGLLDWAVSIRKEAKSRLRRYVLETGDIAPRRALAFSGVGGYGNKGLSIEGLVSSRGVVQGNETQEPEPSCQQDRGIYFSRLVSKEFIGHSQVYNLTVCPGHSYVANSVIVHNCPFACNFCGGRRSPFLRKIRSRSTALVIAEMRHLYETYKTTGFMFFDDELNVNRQFMDLLTAIQALQDELSVDFRLRGFLKSELITEPMATAMYAAGFRQVLVGFESGDPRILENIQKKATREQNTRAVEMLRRNGLSVKAAMSIGHPGESAETIDASRQWLLEVQPDEFDVTVITVYPGTPYYDDAIQNTDGTWTYTDRKTGDRLHAYPTDHLSDVPFYKGTPGSYQSFVFTDYLSAAELCAYRDGLEADVRSFLRIPYPTGFAETNYESSMGMGR